LEIHYQSDESNSSLFSMVESMQGNWARRGR